MHRKQQQMFVCRWNAARRRISLNQISQFCVFRLVAKEPTRRTDGRDVGTVFVSVIAWEHQPPGTLNQAAKYYVQSVLLL